MFSRNSSLGRHASTASRMLSTSLLTGCLVSGCAKHSAAQTVEGTSERTTGVDAVVNDKGLSPKDLNVVRTDLKALSGVLEPLARLDSVRPGTIVTNSVAADLQEQFEGACRTLLSYGRYDSQVVSPRTNAALSTTSLVIALTELNGTLAPTTIASNWSTFLPGKTNTAGGLAVKAAIKELKTLDGRCVEEIARRTLEASEAQIK